MDVRCDVVDCRAAGTGSYLHARRDTATRFAVCDAHLEQLRRGGRPVVVDGPDWRTPALLIR